MKIVGCLSWYDESPSWLAASVASTCRFADHLVAVDGAYALFPGAEPRSGTEQYDAIRETAHALGRGLTIHTPDDVWWGNEVQKRNAMLRLALQVADSSDDWLFIFDADVVVGSFPADLRELLCEAETFNVAGVSLVERYDLQEWPEVIREFDVPSRSVVPLHRMFYRALPDLRVVGTHWQYVAGKGDERRILWGPAELGPEDALDLSMFRAEHRSNLRDMGRKKRSLGYYAQRDALGIERVGVSLVEGLDGIPREVGA